jgi:hypothetical protein
MSAEMYRVNRGVGRRVHSGSNDPVVRVQGFRHHGRHVTQKELTLFSGERLVLAVPFQNPVDVVKPSNEQGTIKPNAFVRVYGANVEVHGRVRMPMPRNMMIFE